MIATAEPTGHAGRDGDAAADYPDQHANPDAGTDGYPDAVAEPDPQPHAGAEPDACGRNRDGNGEPRRQTARGSGRQREGEKRPSKGRKVTIHEAKTDSTGKLWYYLTVDDSKGRGAGCAITSSRRSRRFPQRPRATRRRESTAGGEETADSTETSANQEVIATAKTNRAANLRQTMGGQGACAAQKGHKGQHLRADDEDKKATSGSKAQAQNGEGRLSARLRGDALDKGASTTGSSASTAAAAEDLQDREVIGKATTNRAANVREEPLANATVVRQLGNGMELQILAKYAGVKEETWYEVVTASGKTHGFVRDYVV